jgi:hypothetical protein
VIAVSVSVICIATGCDSISVQADSRRASSLSFLDGCVVPEPLAVVDSLRLLPFLAGCCASVGE